ncbi:hypothetical protein AB9F42_28435 [Rhizobium leguminosarum]|uniref:hypothetical protein n=1 Tax=Rhizobium leguminosarum TaxID=384 RepID=UPI003F954A26
MTIYRTNQPFVKLYDSATAKKEAYTLGAGFSRFEGNGTTENDRLKVTRLGQTSPFWWIDDDCLTALTAQEVAPEFPPLHDREFYQDASLAARMLSGFLGAGGMNVEYLLLLAWAESNWANTDEKGRDGADADLSGRVGPFRFSKDLWLSLLQDPDYSEVLRGFTELDRIKPQAQCYLAACYGNRLQRRIRSVVPTLDPPAWLLRLGHRVGEEAIVGFTQLANGDSVSTTTGGAEAIPAAITNANAMLFPRQSSTTRAEVHEVIRAEFESGKRAVVKRLGDLVQESSIDGMIEGGSSDFRTGALGLLDFIGKYEANGNWNAVVDRVKNENDPPLVTMSIEAVLNYQRNKLGLRNACGKYQIVESTLRGNYPAAGLTKASLFDRTGQDKIAYQLLMSVRKGKAFLEGSIDFDSFALNVAQEWAAMPVLKKMTGHNNVEIERGDSYYSGTGGNRAQVSADEFEAAIQKFQSEAKAQLLAAVRFTASAAQSLVPA